MSYCSKALAPHSILANTVNLSCISTDSDLLRFDLMIPVLVFKGAWRYHLSPINDNLQVIDFMLCLEFILIFIHTLLRQALAKL